MTNKTANPAPTPGTRLVKFISASGAASRRGAGDLVKAGRVKVNGALCPDPAYSVQSGDRVELDGRLLTQEERLYYIMLNKPRGYVCTNADPFAEQKAVDLITLPDAPRLFSAGRLDKESEGLLIFSNDGDYVAKLTHPSQRILKAYQVETDRPIPPEACREMEQGIIDEGETLAARSVTMIAPGRYRFILNEGKKREIRRLTRHYGVQVKRLIRQSVGLLTLGSLPSGKFRKLTTEELRNSLVMEKFPTGQ